MSKHSKLIQVSKMQMFDSIKYWNDVDFDFVGHIFIGKRAVFQDIPHKQTTHCFSFDNIRTLEYKRIIINYHGHNREVSGCVFHNMDGVCTLVCDIEVYQKIKKAWFEHYKFWAKDMF